jgi:hypothetical protein
MEGSLKTTSEEMNILETTVNASQSGTSKAPSPRWATISLSSWFGSSSSCTNMGSELECNLVRI